MKTLKFSLFVFSFIFLFWNLSSAQDVANNNVVKKTSCKLLAMTMWMGQEATTKTGAKAQIKNVTMLQKKLQALGFYGEEPRVGKNYDEGFFDKSTKLAVQKYQEENLSQYKATGSVGPKTLEYLNKYEFCNADRNYADLKLDKVFEYPIISKSASNYQDIDIIDESVKSAKTTSSKIFSFRYPSSDLKLAKEIPLKEARQFRTYLQTCNVDEYSKPDFLQKTLCFKKQIFDTNFSGASLYSNIIEDKKTEGACSVFQNLKKQSVKGEKENINGFDFYRIEDKKIGLGNSIKILKYRIFNKGKCFEFTISVESSRITEDDGSLEGIVSDIESKLKIPLENLYFY